MYSHFEWRPGRKPFFRLAEERGVAWHTSHGSDRRRAEGALASRHSCICGQRQNLDFSGPIGYIEYPDPEPP